MFFFVCSINQGYHDHLILNPWLHGEDASHLVQESHQYYPVRGLRHLWPNHRPSRQSTEETRWRLDKHVLRQGELLNCRELRLRCLLDRNLRRRLQYLLRHLRRCSWLQYRTRHFSKWRIIHQHAYCDYLRLSYWTLRSHCWNRHEYSVWRMGQLSQSILEK